MNKFIPDLPVDSGPSDIQQPFGIDVRRIPDASNDIAAVLAANDLRLRSFGAALARVLGWLAFTARNDIAPEEFLKAVTDQSLNYYRAFLARLGSE